MGGAPIIQNLFVIGCIIAIVFGLVYYCYSRIRIAKEWNERDKERIKKIEETGIYVPSEKPYW